MKARKTEKYKGEISIENNDKKLRDLATGKQGQNHDGKKRTEN